MLTFDLFELLQLKSVFEEQKTNADNVQQMLREENSTLQTKLVSM